MCCHSVTSLCDVLIWHVHFILRLLTIDEDGDVAVMQKVVADAAHYSSTDDVLASRSHDNRVGVELLGGIG